MTKEPIVDIVVLTYNQPGWLDLCVRSVEHFTRNAFRLIVVDNGSVDPKMRVILDDIEKRGHTVVRLEENRCFSTGVNTGVMVGSAKFVVILNDDCQVTESWDTNLLTDAAERTVGLVGAKSNYAGGAQGMPGFVGEPPFLVFVAVCMRREVWNAVGPMDSENFDGFSSEDLDYSWRVRKAGYKLKVSNAYVLHAGSRSIGQSVGDAEARHKNDLKYNDVLRAKWGEEWVKTNTTIIPKILLVSYHAEEWTRVKFMGSMLNLRYSGGYAYTFMNSVRLPIHMARQAAATHALDQGFDYLVQLDDDATFPPDTLLRMLGHQKEVVTALAYQRREPYYPCIFSIGEDGMMGTHLMNYERTGLRQVGVSGFHCSVIKTTVFKKLRDAGIVQFYGGFENKVGEDFALCLNLKKIGVPVHCDTDLISGHIGDAVVVDETFRDNYFKAKGL